MMNLCIVIPVKEGKYIKRCLESTKHLSIPFDIYIVDSCSDDKSYFEIAKEYGTILQNNKNWELGAFWKVIDNINNIDKYTHYLLLQDSMYFKSDLELNFSEDFVYTYTKYRGWEHAVGFDRLPEAQIFQSETGINVSINDFIMFQCSLFLCKSEHIKQLENINFRKFIPLNKQGSECAERIMGIVFKEIKANISEIELNRFIIKEYGDRK